MRKKNTPQREAEKTLKKKTLLFAMWDCENRTAWPYQNAYLPIKNFFKDAILFDPRKKRFEYGGEKMKKIFLNIVDKNKPDYILCMVGSDEFNIDMIEDINKISPKTKIIAHFGDDDIDFEIFSRYYILFLDYGIVFQTHFLPKYKKDGIKNKTFFVGGANLNLYKPLNLKKEYDVSFIGAPLPSRVELMRFLLKNGIKINLWGRGWDNYPEFKDIYHGPLNDKDFVKVINKSKINLGFTRNKYNELHMKGRVFEVGACKSFQLVDYFLEYKKYFRENKEIVMFRDESDLLKKIKYYLENEKEREGIAYNSYRRIKKEYDISKKYKELLIGTLRYKNKRVLPKQNKKIIEINKGDFFDIVNLKKKIKHYDYLSLNSGNSIFHKYKNYLHVYSMEKTKKEISCCSYYLYSSFIGNYMSFRTFPALKNLKKENFDRLLSINQIAVSKSFFLDNIDKFKKILNGEVIDFINEKNTAFIALPLAQIKINRNIRKIISKKKSLINKAFQTGFSVRLYSLAKQHKIFSNNYTYKFLFWALLTGNIFIIKYLFRFLSDKRNIAILKN